MINQLFVIYIKNNIDLLIKLICTLLCSLGLLGSSFALTFNLPTNNSNIVGHVRTIFIEPGESLNMIAQENNIGIKELILANKHINPDKLKAWSKIIIPSSFILPDTVREGIIINIPEMRLYYYPKNSNVVMTFPIGVGRQGWKTPTGSTRIIEKKVDPEWNVPKSIKAYMAKKGVMLPNVIPPGPNNPLGAFAMRLAIPGYLIHGTNKQNTVGKRSSSGCIRMFADDIKPLFNAASIGDKVQIINQPYKAGWYKDDLYLEAHQPFFDQMPKKVKFENVRSVVTRVNNKDIVVDWDSASMIKNKYTGYPQLITKGY